MADLKPTVVLTSATVEKMSRHEMLDWVNSTVNGNYKKIEELSSGVAYCQMMEMIFPRCIGIKKVKIGAKLEHECLHNLKLFQNAFTRLKFDKTVPIDRLIKARFQDNLEFLQWFKKFYDTHAAGKENLKVPTSDNGNAAALLVTKMKPLKISSASGSKKVDDSIKHTQAKSNTPTEDSKSANNQTTKSTKTLRAVQEELMSQMILVEKDRNYYYEKLQQIEFLVTDAIQHGEKVEFCQNVLKIMYAADGAEPTPDSDAPVQNEY